MKRKEMMQDVNRLLQLRNAYQSETRSLRCLDKEYGKLVRRYHTVMREAHLAPHRITIDAYHCPLVKKEMDRFLMAFFYLSMNVDQSDIQVAVPNMITAHVSRVQTAM